MATSKGQKVHSSESIAKMLASRRRNKALKKAQQANGTSIPFDAIPARASRKVRYEKRQHDPVITLLRTAIQLLESRS